MVSRSRGRSEDSHSDHGRPGPRRVKSPVKGEPWAGSEQGTDLQAWPCLAGKANLFSLEKFLRFSLDFPGVSGTLTGFES